MKKPLRIDLENALGLRHYTRIFYRTNYRINYRIYTRIKRLP